MFVHLPLCITYSVSSEKITLDVGGVASWYAQSKSEENGILLGMFAKLSHVEMSPLLIDGLSGT